MSIPEKPAYSGLVTLAVWVRDPDVIVMKISDQLTTDQMAKMKYDMVGTSDAWLKGESPRLTHIFDLDSGDLKERVQEAAKVVIVLPGTVTEDHRHFSRADLKKMPDNVAELLEEKCHKKVSLHNNAVSFTEGVLRWLKLTEDKMPSSAMTFLFGAGVAVGKYDRVVSEYQLSGREVKSDNDVLWENTAAVCGKGQFGLYHVHGRMRDALSDPAIRGAALIAFFTDLANYLTITEQPIPAVMVIGGDKADGITQDEVDAAQFALSALGVKTELILLNSETLGVPQESIILLGALAADRSNS